MDVFFTLDLLGTAVFAHTGALAAKRQKFHILGVFYIAFLTAVGGGTLRSILLQTPELFWMKSSAYLITVGIVVALSYLAVMRFNTNRLWFYLLDSQSLAIFVALGAYVTLQQGQPIHIAFAMGILSGIGGGLIRDAITSQPPQALSDPAYPIMMFTAAIGAAAALKLNLPAWTLACAGVFVVVTASATINYFRTGKAITYHREPPATTTIEPPELSRYSQPQRTGQPHSNATRRVSANKKPKPLLLAGTQALMVIGLACVTGFYFFATPSPANIPTTTSTAMATTSVDQNFQLTVDAAGNHLNNRRLDKAEILISRLALIDNTDTRFVQLQTKATKLRTYLELLDQGELALAKNELAALQQAVSAATKLGFSDQRLQTLTISLLNAREREDINKANKNLTEEYANLHIANATQHIDAGNIKLAQAQLEKARHYAAEESRLSQLEQRIAEIRKPAAPAAIVLQDADVEYANNQFKRLAKAIRLRNISAVSSLTAVNSDKQELFIDLFDRYIEIKANITNQTTNQDRKIVSATLHLDNMRLPNGNLIYPPSSYGQINLFIEHTNQGWSKIQW